MNGYQEHEHWIERHNKGEKVFHFLLDRGFVVYSGRGNQ